jgi:S1-C subfamily serine protease
MADTQARPSLARVRAMLIALVAVVALGAAAGTASARTSATSLESGIVVIETHLGYVDGSAAGTGMVLTPSGEILTNNHVIRGATAITVVVPATGRRYTARVVGYDIADDVAVLRAVGASHMATVTTTTAKVAVGDGVVAIGNAGGTGRLTSARGSVTKLDDAVRVADDQGGSVRLTGMIGVNASVVPGDSGGPLLTTSGQVIGMDTAGSAGATFRSTLATQAYAIPITKALSVERQIIGGKSGSRIHVGGTPFIGVQITGVFHGQSVQGAAIADVNDGTPAAAAGLEPGDVITGLDGYKVTSPDSLTAALLHKKPGQRITVRFTDQSGASHSLSLTLASGAPQ